MPCSRLVLSFFLLVSTASRAAPDTLRVLFPYRAARLTNAARTTLDVAQYNGFFENGAFDLHGHADSSGNEGGNSRLSAQRIAAVRDYLTKALRLQLDIRVQLSHGEQGARGGRGAAGMQDRAVVITRRRPEPPTPSGAGTEPAVTARSMQQYSPKYIGAVQGDAPPGFGTFVRHENDQHHASYLRQQRGEAALKAHLPDTTIVIHTIQALRAPERKTYLLAQLAHRRPYGPGAGSMAEELALIYALEHKPDSLFAYLEAALQGCPATDSSCNDVWDPGILNFYQFAPYKTLPAWKRFERSVRQRFAAHTGIRDPEPALELLLAAGLDQSVRFRLPVADPQLPDWQRRVQQQNHVWIWAFIRKHGYPRASRVGADAAEAAFLLVQHTEDTALQHHVLQLMQPMLATHDVAPECYALLTDRYWVNAKGYQWYGTQYQSGYVLHPIRDADSVNERRKALGLGPLRRE